MIAFIIFGEVLYICSQDIEWKRNFGLKQGLQLWYKCVKTMCNNPNIDLGNMNAYIKFGEILSICSQDN